MSSEPPSTQQNHGPEDDGHTRFRPPTAMHMHPSTASRIEHWILTGSHVITATSNDQEEKRRRHGVGSFTAPSLAEPDEDDEATSYSSHSAPSVDPQLVGCDGDLLIPTAQEIAQTYQGAKQTWSQFVSRAEALPPTCGFCDPSVMLKDVPALPERVPRKLSIRGVPVWRIQTGEGESDEAPDGGTPVHGLDKWLTLLMSKPAVCHFSPTPHVNVPDSPRGLGVLTLCWSYVMSIKLLELQRRAPRYSQTCLQPTPFATYTASEGDFVIDLRAPASPALVRWLSAILAPELGWCVRGPVPVWTVRGSSESVNFVILTDKPMSFDSNERPPNSSQATKLLIELCSLFGLGGGQSDQDSPPSNPMAPCTAAFLAVLGLPILRFRRVELQLGVGQPIKRQRTGLIGHNTDSTRIRQYAADLRYYMTLSADDFGVQSTLWSVFWQPDITCNLVGPWLSGTLDALRPLIEAGDITTLAKTFALRRPRVALWWLSLFLFNRAYALDEMVRWLETTEGQRGRGLAALSWPDITRSTWTGCPNSFWDHATAGSYPDLTDMVPREDVLRCRFNQFLQDDHWQRSFCWRPFGQICKTDVELDIWPSLERGCTREYVHWLWWAEKDQQPDVQLGFRRDTGRFVDGVHGDDLSIVEVPKVCGVNVNVSARKQPSIVATGKMLLFFMTDARGSIAECIAALPGFESHKWHKHWNILPSRW